MKFLRSLFGLTSKPQNDTVHNDTVHHTIISGITYTITDATTCAVTGCRQDKEVSVDIPQSVTIGGKIYTVTAINDLSGCENLVGINIPDSVTTIGDNAFDGCKSLSSIHMPGSVTTIGDNAFDGCKALKHIYYDACPPLHHRQCLPQKAEIHFPSDGTTDFLEYDITGYTTCAVVSCSELALGDVTIPKTVNIDGSDYTVTAIGDEAFSDEADIKSINIPDSVTTIGDYAFAECSSLRNIVIPDSVTTIGDYAFFECRALTSINIPNSITTIGNAFCMSGLRSINIPEGVTTIGNGAFSGCNALTVNIPDSVTTIGDDAFCLCSFTTINIPSSVTTIGKRTFLNCTALTSIDVDSNNCAYTSKDGVLFNKRLTEILCFPGGKPDDTYTIPEDVTTIGDSAFSGCKVLRSINIPDSVTTIGDDAFSGCTALRSINIPEGVTTIGDSAFSGCTALRSINIPEGVTTISECAFSGCTALRSINIPESVTTFGECAFSGCTALRSINIPESVTTIGESAFGWCDALKHIYNNARTPQHLDANLDLPDDATIHVPQGCASAYEEAEYWQDYTIKDDLETAQSSKNDEPIIEDCALIPDIAFAITSPTTCAVASTTRETGDNVFIPEAVIIDGKLYNVTAIGEGAFHECEDIAHISIPNTVTTIGNNAFRECSNLQSIIIPPSVTAIGDSVFRDCSRLRSINIPKGVTTIGENAFRGCIALLQINVDCSNNDYVSKDGILFNKGLTWLLAYPVGKEGDTYSIPNGVTSIRSGAFTMCTALKSVTIPDSVLHIGEAVFKGCTALEDIYNYARQPQYVEGYLNFEDEDLEYASPDYDEPSHTTAIDTDTDFVIHIPHGCICNYEHDEYGYSGKWSFYHIIDDL